MPLLEELEDDELVEQIAAIKAEQKRRKDKRKWPQEYKFYLHSSKDDNWERAEDLKFPDEEAKRHFSYCGYEVEFTLVVQKDGSSVATHVGGIKLETPLEMS